MRRLIPALGLWLAAESTPVSAQAMREVRALPGDCRQVLPPGTRGVQQWQALVELEHCDRIKRLRRLSEDLPPERRPMFYEGVVPADRLPPEFGVDMPVLRVVFPERVFFDTGSADPRYEAEAVTAIVAESLRREPPDVALFIAGHADRRGGAAFNHDLSIDRANALAEAIFARGIAFSSIWRIGFGEDMPLVEGDDPAAYDRNRRIEFLFAAKPEAVGTWLADQQRLELCQARTRAESQRCKASLTFRRDYEAVQIVRRPPVRVAPERSTGRDVRPSRGRPEAIAPRSGASTAARPQATQVVQVAPETAPKFRIDPQAGRAIRVDPRPTGTRGGA